MGGGPVMIVLLGAGLLVVAGQETTSPTVDYCGEDVPLPPMPGNCSTCAGRCGQLTEYKGQRFCSCDHHCAAYGDCCYDFEAQCPEQFHSGEPIRILAEQHGSSTCRMLRSMFTSFRVLLIDFCFKSGIRCNSTVPGNVLNSNLAVPIADLDTGLYYLNAECAQCNGATRVKPWKVQISCDVEVNESDTLNVENLEAALSKKRCLFSYPLSNTDFPGIRKCLNLQPRTTCPGDCKNEILVRKCESPFQSITKGSNTNYKNLYCGLCHEPSELMTLECSDYNPPYPDGIRPVLKPFSLELLFDFDPSRGLTVGQGNRVKDCPKDHIFVQSDGNCRLIVCPQGQRLLNDSCLQNEANATMRILLTFNQTEDAVEVLSFFQNPSPMWTFLTTLQEKLQVVFDDFTLDRNPTNLSLTSAADGLHAVNVTLFLHFEFSPNSTFDQRTDLNVYKENVTKHVNLHIINLLRLLDIDVGSVEVTVDGMLTFEKLPAKDCTWVVYDNNDYDIENNTLRIRGSGREYSSLDFRLIVDGPTLVCVPPEDTDTRLNLDINPALGILTLVLIIPSILCLIVRIILHFFLVYFRSFAGHMQLNLCLSLCLAFILLLVGGALASLNIRGPACHAIGALMYWAFLSAFCWMAAMAYDSSVVFRPAASFRRANVKPRSLLRYMVIGWILPAIVTGIVVGLDFSKIDSRFRPHFGENICWFNQRYSLLVYFGAPVAVLMIITVVFFIMIVLHLRKSFKTTRKVTDTRQSHRAGIYSRLFVIMGLSWSIGFVASFVGHIALWSIFIILNASQGIFIFISFVMRRSVLREIKTGPLSRSGTSSTSVNIGSSVHKTGSSVKS